LRLQSNRSRGAQVPPRRCGQPSSSRHVRYLVESTIAPAAMQ
jgi:hypothetical protein